MNGTQRRIGNTRGQGMTEYIILVGLIAILVIAGVNKYQFSVNEAIQGSVKAWEEADGTRPRGGPPPSPPVGPSIGTDGPGATGRAVFRDASGNTVYDDGSPATLVP
jgi:Flp pilus assembly pilin Flp